MDRGKSLQSCQVYHIEKSTVYGIKICIKNYLIFRIYEFSSHISMLTINEKENIPPTIIGNYNIGIIE